LRQSRLKQKGSNKKRQVKISHQQPFCE